MAKELKTAPISEEITISLDIEGIPVWRDAEGAIIHGIDRASFLAEAKSKLDGRRAYCAYAAACCDERIAILTAKIEATIAKREAYRAEAAGTEPTEEQKKDAKIAKLRKRLLALEAV